MHYTREKIYDMSWKIIVLELSAGVVVQYVHLTRYAWGDITMKEKTKKRAECFWMGCRELLAA